METISPWDVFSQKNFINDQVLNMFPILSLTMDPKIKIF